MKKDVDEPMRFGSRHHVNNDNQQKTTTMTFEKIQIRNVEKAAKYESRSTGKIAVRFPFNDYYRGKGRVFTGEPVEARVPHFRDGSVFVKYDKREFQVMPHARLLVKGYKAQIFWRTI